MAEQKPTDMDYSVADDSPSTPQVGTKNDRIEVASETRATLGFHDRLDEVRGRGDWSGPMKKFGRGLDYATVAAILAALGAAGIISLNKARNAAPEGAIELLDSREPKATSNPEDATEMEQQAIIDMLQGDDELKKRLLDLVESGMSASDALAEVERQNLTLQ